MRPMQPANLDASQQDVVRPVLLLSSQFPSGWLRLWTGLGELVVDDEVYVGAGRLIEVSSIDESLGVIASGMTVSLSGIDMALLSLVIDEARQGQPMFMKMGFLDNEHQLIASPELMFSGLLDVPTITEDGATATITVSFENQLIDLQRPREFRYTHESQRIRFPNDKGLEYVTAIQNKDFKWGR